MIVNFVINTKRLLVRLWRHPLEPIPCKCQQCVSWENMVNEAIDALRYREVRKWTPVTFCNAWNENLKTGKSFDKIVDDMRRNTVA